MSFFQDVAIIGVYLYTEASKQSVAATSSALQMQVLHNKRKVSTKSKIQHIVYRLFVTGSIFLEKQLKLDYHEINSLSKV